MEITGSEIEPQLEVRQRCECAAAAAVNAAKKQGVALSPDAIDLLARFCAEIVDVSTHTNVTALRTPEAMGSGLFLESLIVLHAVAPYVLETPRVVDVGSGAGIPGIPLAIARPAWSFTLVESIEKKAIFLRRVVERLSLSRVEVMSMRAETFGVETGRDCFDLAVARAVAALPTLLELCAPLVRAGGLLALPKSGNIAAEIQSASAAAEALRLEWISTFSVAEESGLETNRCIVLYRKLGSTPAGFPRRTGVAKTQPLGASRSTAATARGRPPRRE